MQLLKDLNGVTAEQMDHVAIAYEPVWAIGTGLVSDMLLRLKPQCLAKYKYVDLIIFVIFSLSYNSTVLTTSGYLSRNFYAKSRSLIMTPFIQVLESC